MKLALLLAQYLYSHKKLDLPGIGTFHLDPSVIIDPEVFSTPEGEVEVTQTILTFEEEGNGESMTDENKEDASA